MDIDARLRLRRGAGQARPGRLARVLLAHRRASWKVWLDGYLEGYHFASLHRTRSSKQNMSNVMATDAYGLHQHRLRATDRVRDKQDGWSGCHIGPLSSSPRLVAGCWGDRAIS
jgi:hypothetical protein